MHFFGNPRFKALGDSGDETMRDASGQGEPLLAAAKRMLASRVWGWKGEAVGRHLVKESERSCGLRRLHPQDCSLSWKKPEAYAEREALDAIFTTQGQCMKWLGGNRLDDDERHVDSVAEFWVSACRLCQTIPFRVR